MFNLFDATSSDWFTSDLPAPVCLAIVAVAFAGIAAAVLSAAFGPRWWVRR